MLTTKTNGNALAKIKIANFFRLESFVKKTKFNSHTLDKLMILLLLNMLPQDFLVIFYVDPLP